MDTFVKRNELLGRIIELTDNMSTKSRVVLCAAEAGGTAILVFLGCMGCVAPIAAAPHLQVSFTFGLAVMIAIQIFGHISGAHINPVVTIAAATLGNISLLQVPIYFVGQFLGALLGFGLLVIATPGEKMGTLLRDGSIAKHPGICTGVINSNISAGQACFVEFLLSLILVLFCCGVWDARNSDKHDSIPVRFGLAVAVLAMAGGPYTGAHMNPVRSLVPALFNGDWENHWIYWIGPLCAGFVGGILYRLIFNKKKSTSSDTLPENISLNLKA